MRAFGTLATVLMLLSLLPAVAAVDIGTGVNINMNTEEFKPLAWMCDSRRVIDDDIEPGRVNGDMVWSHSMETCECVYENCLTACVAGQTSTSFECNGLICEINFEDQVNLPQLCVSFCEGYTLKFSCPIEKGFELIERHANYAFEGEKVEWVLLAMDKNKIEEIDEVVVTIGPKRSGRLEDYCALEPLNIYIDGQIVESDWGSPDFHVNVPGDSCDYNVYIENDCDPVYIAIEQEEANCTSNATMEILMQVAGDEVNIVPLASASAGFEQAEFRFTSASLNVQSGDTIRLAFRAYSDFRYPQTGFVSHRLASEWRKRSVFNDVEVECVELHGYAGAGSQVDPSCNARIGQEVIDQFDPQTMAYYECTFSVEPPSSMYGEYWVVPEVISVDGEHTISRENEYWFFNPVIALTIDGFPDFGVVRPGTISYSNSILISNDADHGSGVLLDMFISGTDFYDPMSQGSRCVITNRLKLGNNRAASGNNGAGGQSQNRCDIGFGDADDHFCYYAVNGAYGTYQDSRSDSEGYVPIVYGDSFSRDFYNDAEIIQANQMGAYWMANVLTPGADLALTFKLGLPEPCFGDFTDGSIYFWGEAI